MNRRIWTVLASLLLLNVLAAVVYQWRRSAGLNEAYAKENKEISGWIASRAVTSQPGPINMIGNLALGSHYSKILLLAQEQEDTIVKLDRLIKASRYRSMMADAAPFNGPPAAYRKRIQRSEARRRGALHHAQRLVLLGLLTEEQTALVTQRYLQSLQIDALNNDDVGVAERIGLTEEQKRELARVNDRFLKQDRSKIVDRKSRDPAVGEAYRKWNGDWSQAFKQAMWDILTPSQRDTWSRLVAKRPALTAPPDLTPSPASEAEARRIDQQGLSRTFRKLDDSVDALGLTAEQKRLLQGLEQVTRQGLLWISLRSEGGAPASPGEDPKEHADRISNVRAQFLDHAEQVALLGILTQRQAEKLQELLNRG